MFKFLRHEENEYTVMWICELEETLKPFNKIFDQQKLYILYMKVLQYSSTLVHPACMMGEAVRDIWKSEKKNTGETSG
jgi:hypothetical protein